MTLKTSVPQAAAGAGAPAMPRGRSRIEVETRRTRAVRFIRILLGGRGGAADSRISSEFLTNAPAGRFFRARATTCDEPRRDHGAGARTTGADPWYSLGHAGAARGRACRP